MTVTTFVFRNGELIEKDLASPLLPINNFGRAFYYNSDGMDSTLHMANGKRYTSKSEFRKATKAAGCVEVGNSPIRPRQIIKPPRAAPDIKRAIDELKAR